MARSKVNIVAFKEVKGGYELLLHLPNKHFFKATVCDKGGLKDALEGVPKVTDPKLDLETAIKVFNG